MDLRYYVIIGINVYFITGLTSLSLTQVFYHANFAKMLGNDRTVSPTNMAHT